MRILRTKASCVYLGRAHRVQLQVDRPPVADRVSDFGPLPEGVAPRNQQSSIALEILRDNSGRERVAAAPNTQYAFGVRRLAAALQCSPRFGPSVQESCRALESSVPAALAVANRSSASKFGTGNAHLKY